MKRVAFAFALSFAVAACTGDDGPTPVDASGDDGAVSIDAPDLVDGGTVDAPTTCVLPAAPITCTDNTACTAACADAYCYNFNQVGMRCTSACTPGGAECPTGWTCNNMGRCRPPG